MKKYSLKTMSILFSLFFIVILINTIFYNKTVWLHLEIPNMIIWPIVMFLAIFILYKLLKNTKLLKLIYKYKIIIFIILIVIQVITSYFTYTSIGWDCGTVIRESINLFEGKGLKDPMYFAKYQNNIAITSIFKYLYGISSMFMQMNIANYLWVDILLNIILIDISAIVTFKTCKKILGKNGAILSTLFIIPYIIFTPFRTVPYTDTYSQVFPILVFYLFIKTSEDSKFKTLWYFLIGLFFIMGYYIKPTVVIVGIAILIIQILNIKINKKNIKQKNKQQNIKYKNKQKNVKEKSIEFIKNILIIFLGMIIAFGGNLIIKNNNFSKYITKQNYIDNEVPATHFMMMGMNNVDNRWGAFNEQDCIATETTMGLANKKEMNIKVIKERLKNYGIIGYAKFLYGKSNFILNDGTFFFEGEGNFYTSKPYNTSNIATNYRNWKKENKSADIYFRQALWILLIIGLIFSSNKKFENTDNEAIVKLTIIGIVMFLLLFEGRSRYLVNHLPFFIILGTLGIKNVIKTLENKLTKIKRKEVKKSE